MDKFHIEGGVPLTGQVKVSGAKNSALPIMAAALISPSPKRIKNVPDLVDIHTMADLLRQLGVRCDFDRAAGIMSIDPSEVKTPVAPYEIVKKMRASYYVLGALLARLGQAQVSLPGGCAIGARPIDLHIKGVQGLGAEVKIEHGYVHAKGQTLKGATIMLLGAKGTSVGATINVMMAATRASGHTVITPAACEPEIIDVANFLNKTGAHITGAGTPRLTIEGVQDMHDAVYDVIPDRIEAGTFACAAAITNGQVSIEQCRPEHMTAIIETLREIGAEVRVSEHEVSVRCAGRPKATSITVAPYPGFPTDTQAQFMALLAVAQGQSSITETIFENRFMQAVELMRMGANIKLKDDTAIINGVAKLSGAKVMASDLRASASLVLAALAAEGPTEISRIYHLDRGYEHFEQKLAALGAKIKRVK